MSDWKNTRDRRYFNGRLVTSAVTNEKMSMSVAKALATTTAVGTTAAPALLSKTMLPVVHFARRIVR